MGTTNSNFLPNETGLDLGSPTQQWDGFFDNLTVNDTFISGGVTIASGNATKLQGYPISPNAPALNQALIWNGTVWIPTNQSGGTAGATFGYVATAYSATPVFVPNPVGSCTFAITLTGNVTSSTFTSAGLSAGALFNFKILQDGSGAHTFAWPALALGTQPISTTANQTTVQNFFWDGTNLLATGFPVVF